MAQQTARSRALATQERGNSRGHWNRETHARQRDCSLTLGRFIERDPIGFEAGDNNWYRFVTNGPTIATDSTGLAKPSAPRLSPHAPQRYPVMRDGREIGVVTVSLKEPQTPYRDQIGAGAGLFLEYTANDAGIDCGWIQHYVEIAQAEGDEPGRCRFSVASRYDNFDRLDRAFGNQSDPTLLKQPLDKDCFYPGPAGPEGKARGRGGKQNFVLPQPTLYDRPESDPLVKPEQYIAQLVETTGADAGRVLFTYYYFSGPGGAVEGGIFGRAMTQEEVSRILPPR